MLPLHAALGALPARALRRLLPPTAARLDGSTPGALPPGPSSSRGLATSGPPQQQETDHTKSAPFWIVGGMIAVALTASAMKRRLASQEARGELARRANDSLDAQGRCACMRWIHAFVLHWRRPMPRWLLIAASVAAAAATAAAIAHC